MRTATPEEPNAQLGGPVASTLLSMAGPISLGMLSTLLFQVVDTYFVGQLGGRELAALGFAASTYFLAVSVFMGMAVGVSALVGAALGSSNRRLAQRYTTVSTVTALALASLVAGVGIVSLRPLFAVLGAGPSLIPLIETYMGVLYLGMPLLVFGLVGGSALRASGTVKAPEIIMGIAGVINLVLDYVLIFGVGPFPRLGLQGAAIATVASWLFLAVCIVALLARKRLLSLQKGQLVSELRQIASLSAPAIATQVLLPLTAMFITYLAAKSGPEVVAAFGVAQRIETLALVGISAMTVAIVPFVAQNYGAKSMPRVDRAVAFAGKSAVYWGVGVCLLLMVFAEPIARLFSADAEIIRLTKLYFYVVSASYAGFGIVVITAAVFNAVRLPVASVRVLLVKSVLTTVPLAAIGSLFGAVGVFAAIGLSNIGSAIYAAVTMKRTLSSIGSRIADASPADDYRRDLRAVADTLRWSSNKP